CPGNNAALQGKPTQSSLCGFGFAYNAIDGNHNDIWEDGSSSCTNTKVKVNSSMALHMLKRAFGHLSPLSLWCSLTYNTRKSVELSTLLSGSLYESDELTWSCLCHSYCSKAVSISSCRCAVISSIPAGFSSTFQCNGMEGRYVNVVLPGRSEYLTVCEVEVYGSPLD
ncbi:fucolectin-7-like, partial [Salvelinus alpinus]